MVPFLPVLGSKETSVAERVLIEEFHLALTTPAVAADPAREAMRQVLNSRTVRAALRRAVQAVLTAHPILRPVRFTLAR
jgi:hypothetical protein